VWGPIERSRGFAVAADALAHHIGPEAAGPITSGAFGLSDADHLSALVSDANFKNVTVRASVKTLRYTAARLGTGCSLKPVVSVPYAIGIRLFPRDT
jgi:hypothetical protein